MTKRHDIQPRTEHHVKSSQRMNLAAYVAFQATPIGIILAVLAVTHKVWFEHHAAYIVLAVVVVILVLQKTLPYRLGGNRKPRW
jgi:predicted permease